MDCWLYDVTAAMEIDLAGATVILEGDRNLIAEASFAALIANGGRIAEGPHAKPGIVLVSCPLMPESANMDPRTIVLSVRQTAMTMAHLGGGRIVFLLSALAGMPMRRHPEFSADMAGALASVRTLAMEFGPKVLVNAVGVGLTEAGTTISGDAAQLSHIPLGRPGSVREAVAAVLFLCDPMNSYTTGQMLSVDGGWTAGYGRNF
jgi:NAD(P)-dependent dehydrogenase (short-subunit alcohol dehydrogenase family)